MSAMWYVHEIESLIDPCPSKRGSRAFDLEIISMQPQEKMISPQPWTL